jgi:hypothetical protein
VRPIEEKNWMPTDTCVRRSQGDLLSLELPAQRLIPRFGKPTACSGWILLGAIISLFLIRSTAFAFQSSSSGGIQGTAALESSGAPLAGATITAVRITPAVPLFTATAVTGLNGSFVVSGLPTGQYGLCIEPKGNVLDPCQWRSFLTTVNVKAGSTTSGVSIRAKAASSFTLRLNDTGQFLISTAAAQKAPHIVVGVFDGSSVFHPAQESRDSTGITYRISIPYDVPLKLVVVSPHATLSNALGAALPLQGLSQTILQSSSQPQLPTVTFNVTGKH